MARRFVGQLILFQLLECRLNCLLSFLTRRSRRSLDQISAAIWRQFHSRAGDSRTFNITHEQGIAQFAAGLDGSASSVRDSDVVVRGQGEFLVACLREVLSLFFKEDFALEDGGTFRPACPFSSILETGVLQEKLSHYLDIVELHLVKKISLRSDSFFEAQVQLQDSASCLNVVNSKLCLLK